MYKYKRTQLLKFLNQIEEDLTRANNCMCVDKRGINLTTPFENLRKCMIEKNET
jgi:hypothetical protein